VWSTDWFQRQAEQLGKIAEALEKAKCILKKKTYTTGALGFAGS
jgi:hypothetical protein